jgi:hypothetical protein
MMIGIVQFMIWDTKDGGQVLEAGVFSKIGLKS